MSGGKIIDYNDLPDSTARMSAALSSMIDGGTDENKAVSIAALSVSEAGLRWTIARKAPVIESLSGVPSQIATCAPMRTTVGLEATFASDGERVIPSRLNDGSPVNDRIINLLQLAQMVERLRDGRVAYRGPALTPNSDGLAQFFEVVMAFRAGKWLGQFSIGPTQMWMAQTQMAKDAGDPTNFVMPTFPATWEELWAFYTSRTALDLASKINYLKPVTGKWPNQDTSQANVTRWLSQQIGRTPDSERVLCYYSPETCPAGSKQVSAHFKTNLSFAMSTLAKLKAAGLKPSV